MSQYLLSVVHDGADVIRQVQSVAAFRLEVFFSPFKTKNNTVDSSTYLICILIARKWSVCNQFVTCCSYLSRECCNVLPKGSRSMFCFFNLSPCVCFTEITCVCVCYLDQVNPFVLVFHPLFCLFVSTFGDPLFVLRPKKLSWSPAEPAICNSMKIR